MIEVHRSLTVARPVETVFAFAADPRNNPEWWKPVISVEVLSDTGLARYGSQPS